MEHKATGAELPDFAEGINLHGERLRLERVIHNKKESENRNSDLD